MRLSEPIKSIEEILELIPQLIGNKPASSFLFTNSRRTKLDRTIVFYSFKNICSELRLNEKYSIASWRKTFAYHYYKKYRDISYLIWLFNQHKAEVALKFIDENRSNNAQN